MIKTILFGLIAGIALIGGCGAKGANLQLPEKFVQAEISVESGGRNNATGDDGKAIGCLQIHKACWKDSIEFSPSIGGVYSNCFNRAYSVKIMQAYLNRYCRRAVQQNDFETMARTWNGGANGPNNPKTISYWLKVNKIMKK